MKDLSLWCAILLGSGSGIIVSAVIAWVVGRFDDDEEDWPGNDDDWRMHL